MVTVEHQAKFEVSHDVIIHYDLDTKEGETRPAASKLPQLLTTTFGAVMLTKSVYRVSPSDGEEPQTKAMGIWKAMAVNLKGHLRANDRIYVYYPAREGMTLISAVLSGNENALENDPLLRLLGDLWKKS